MNDPYRQRQEQIADRLLQASFGLWNALITVNGILLAAVSVVQVLEPDAPPFLVLALIAGCVCSLALLVYNHVATKSVYFRIGEVLSDEGEDLSDEKRRTDIQNTVKLHRRVRFSENACLTLLVIEAALVFVIIAMISCGTYAT